MSTLRCYVDKRFNEESLKILHGVAAVCDEYEAAGYQLTVRQIHYQFVSRGWLPNTTRTYDRLQALISDGRLAGLLSWTAIEDRGRNLKGLETWESPGAAVRQVRQSYRRDLWADQRMRPEIWIEKQALEGVIEGICDELRVNFYACRGYDSQSQSWRAGRRFADYVQRGQTPVVLHLGDHDPSGIDMTRDNHERLSMFAGFPVCVQRIALNWDQIERHAPPPNPAKLSDSRAASYVAEYGYDSWELDALEPRVLRDLIADEVAKLRDEIAWSASLEEEVQERRALEDAERAMGAKRGEST